MTVVDFKFAYRDTYPAADFVDRDQRAATPPNHLVCVFNLIFTFVCQLSDFEACTEDGNVSQIAQQHTLVATAALTLA